MYKFTRSLTVLGYVLALVLASTPSWAVDSQQVTEMIAKADSYRLNSAQASKVVSVVALYQDEQLDKTREYNVYTRPNRESLVVFKSAVEAGQKMLMIEDNYWLLMPKSRRPIRITPMQKLLGEASVGISRRSLGAKITKVSGLPSNRLRCRLARHSIPIT